MFRLATPLGLLLLGGVGFAWLSREPAKAKLPPGKPQPLRTRVLELRPTNHPVIIRTHGVVRSHHEVTVSAQVAGKIARIHSEFEDGAFFTTGAVLVELEADDHRGTVAIAEARVASARAALDLARLDHDRNVQMLQGRLLPQAQADATAAQLAQATAQLHSASAQLEQARRDLERTRVRAPFNGCVRRRAAGPGQLVGPGTALGTVFAVDSVEVRLPIAVRELRHLELPASPADPPVEVELRDAVNRDSPAVWPGRIIRTEGALDESSLDLFAIARVEDPFGRQSGGAPLRLGQPVTAAIRGRVLEGVFALPRGAVRELDRIYLVDRESLKLRSHRVQALWADETTLLVRDRGLADGTWLATTHLVYAPEGAPVEIVRDTPATNAPPGVATAR